MSETLNDQHWFLQPNSSSSSSSFGYYSSMASSDANSSTTQITTTTTNTNSNTNTNTNTPPKPIKRRSRSSRRTPTTLLNANTTNFRALVQQFTGYHSAGARPSSLKGPVNLDFQLGSVSLKNNTDQSNCYGSSAGFGGFSGCDYDQDQFQTQIQLQQQQQQQQQVNVLSEDVNVQTRSGEVGFDDLGSMIVGDGVYLMDDVAAFRPLSDQGFFWNVHNQFPSLSHTD